MADSDGGASHQELPDDVILDHIIARLPPKRAAQCSLLDRNVRRRISSPEFRVRNAALTSRAATVFHCSATDPKVFTRFCDGAGSQRSVTTDLMEETSIMASCNGILLLCIKPRDYYCKRFVFNPSTGAARPVDFPAGSATSVALAADLDEDGGAGPPFKVVTADVKTEPDQTVVVFSVFVPGTGRSMTLKSRSKFTSRRSYTLAAADINVRPVYVAGFLYWLGGDARLTVSFDLMRQQGRVTDGPVMSTEPDRTGDMWFGHAGGSVWFVHSLQEAIVIYSHDRLSGKWRVERRIPNISNPSNNDYKHGQCAHFDGGRLIFVLRRAEEQGHVHVYDLSTEKWEKSGWRVGYWTDRHQRFFSATPTTTKVSNMHLDDLNPEAYAEKGTEKVCDSYFSYVKMKKAKEKGSSFRSTVVKEESEEEKAKMVKEFDEKEMVGNKVVLSQLHKLFSSQLIAGNPKT